MLTLRRSIYLLSAILVLLGTLYIYSTRCGPDWLKDVTLNVGTEIFGILLTVWLIDAVIKRKEQAERNRVNTVAFAQLRIALQEHVTTLLSMYKASIPHAPPKPPNNFDALFGSDYFVQIAFLDFSKPAPVMSVQPLQWFDFLHTETENFKASLTRTLEKYAVFLSADTVELLEELIASRLVAFLTQVKSIPQIDKKEGFQRQYNFFSGQGMSELVHQHIDLVKRLVVTSNMHLPVDKAIAIDSEHWRNDIAPRFGSARIYSDNSEN